jgi:cell division protein FtsW (lipid II flippase)
VPDSAHALVSAQIHTQIPKRIHATGQRTVLRLWVWELLLTCFSVALLVLVAKPLAEGERSLGLAQRYAESSTAALPIPSIELSSPAVAGSQNHSPSWTQTFSFAPSENDKPQRAQWLNRHAGAVLALLAACGWITLSVGRSISGMRVKQPLIAAFWCVAGHLLGTFSGRWPLPGLPWLPPELKGGVEQWFAATSVWMLAAGVLFLVAMWNGWRSSAMPTPHFQFNHAAASPWVYPGFVLFSGLGWLWLLDWAARGHLNKQFVGIYQVDSLWLAFMVFTQVAAHQGQLLAAISRFASWLDRLSAARVSMPNVLLLSGLLAWTALLVAIAHIGAGDTGQLKIYQRHAAVLAELMRMPVWLALGWVLYRWVETGQRATQGMFVVAALLAVLVSGLSFDHDGGPILAQTIAVVWISSGLVQALLARRFSWMLSWPVAIATAALGTAGAIRLAFANAPSIRVDAMALDYQGPLDFLSVMHWLLDAAPAFGFGIGKTPWCGYAQVVGLVEPCRRAGVPDQIQSDYVASAMLALWGWLPTLLLLAALLLWLWDLLRKGPATHAEALNLGLLRQWIVMGFAVTSGVQIAISVAGTLGTMPLAGLAIPMLSLGGAGLISTAVFAGLSVNRIYLQNGETRRKAMRL